MLASGTLTTSSRFENSLQFFAEERASKLVSARPCGWATRRAAIARQTVARAAFEREGWVMPGTTTALETVGGSGHALTAYGRRPKLRACALGLGAVAKILFLLQQNAFERSDPSGEFAVHLADPACRALRMAFIFESRLSRWCSSRASANIGHLGRAEFQFAMVADDHVLHQRSQLGREFRHLVEFRDHNTQTRERCDRATVLRRCSRSCARR